MVQPLRDWAGPFVPVRRTRNFPLRVVISATGQDFVCRRPITHTRIPACPRSKLPLQPRRKLPELQKYGLLLHARDASRD